MSQKLCKLADISKVYQMKQSQDRENEEMYHLRGYMQEWEGWGFIVMYTKLLSSAVSRILPKL